jgi:phosphate:Na+ symporter
MNTTLTLIDFAGSIALLLWGVHMVQSGISIRFARSYRLSPRTVTKQRWSART